MKFDPTHISKLVGWESGPVAMPTVDRVQAVKKAALAGDEQSAALLLRWNRFGASPQNEEEVGALNAVIRALGDVL